MGIRTDERTEIKDLIKEWADRKGIVLGRISIVDLARDMEMVKRRAGLAVKVKMINELEDLIRRLREEAVREM